MTREQFLAFLARLFGDGEPLTADEFAGFRDGIADHAEDAELADIEAACRELGASDDTPLPVVRAAVDVVAAARETAAERIAAAEAEADERAALRAQLDGEPVAEDAPVLPDEEPDETPDDEPEDEPVAEVVEVLEPVAAAAPARTPAVPRRPAGTALARRTGGAVQPLARTRQHNRIARDGGGEFANLTDAAAAMLAKRESFLSANTGYREEVTVASIIADYPAERQLDGENARANERLFREIVSAMDGKTDAELEAVTAAGGFCAPVTPFYGIPRISTGDRPVRDSLVGYQAVRGGLTYRPPSDFTSFRSANRQWTRANDVTPGADGPTTKPCLTVACLNTETAYLYAVTQCLKFGNFMTMADPETVADATDKTMDAHASLAETLLLDAMKAAATNVVAGSAFGAFRDLLFHWGVTATGYRSRRRMNPNATLELRAPAWVKDMIREDVARSLNAYPDQYAIADDFIARALAVRNIRAYWYIDSPTVAGGIADHSQVFGTQAAALGLVDFPESIQWEMSPPGTWLFLENGRLNLGTVRDATLVGTNDYISFAEDFEGLAHPGYQAIWGVSTVCPNGASAGTTSPDNLCTTGGEYIPTGSGIGAFTAP